MSARCELHFSVSRAMRAQELLRQRVSLKSRIRPCNERIIVALDVAYRRLPDGEYGYGVALAYDGKTRSVIGCMVASRRICVPYIPGLLAFREMAVLGPLAVRAGTLWSPDVLVIDGHGISHPRGMGIASHVGVVTGFPSIGVAKKKLVGRVEGNYIVYNGERVARVVRTRGGSRIFVSPGHMISLEDSASLIMKYMGSHKLPEPLHIADVITKASKKLLRPTSELRYSECPKLLAL